MILLLMTLLCAGHLYGMEPLYPQKPVINLSGPDYMAMLPREIKGLVIVALTESKTLDEAIKAIRALTETNKEFNLIINEPVATRILIHLLVQKFKAPSEYIAQQLSTTGSERYIMLSKRLIAVLWQAEDFATAEQLINAGADIDFQTADTYPIHCGATDQLNPTVMTDLHRLAAILPMLIETQQMIAIIKEIVFKKWPELYLYRKKQSKFLEKIAEEMEPLIMEMHEFRTLSREEQKQKLLASKKYSQQLLAHFQEDLQAGQPGLQAIAQSLRHAFPQNKQWKKLLEKISKGKFQKALDIVTSQQTIKYHGILLFLETGEHTCIIGANFSLLMYAMITSRPAILEWLIKHKADLSLTMGTGDTALLMAMSMGNQQMVELLINNGADINQKSVVSEETDKILRKLGRFMLHVSYLNIYFNPINHMVQFHYDLSLYNSLNPQELGVLMRDALMGLGGSPLSHLVALFMHKKNFNKEQFNALFNLLISKGANLNMQNENEHTALFATVFTNGHANIMKLLLDHGANPTIKDNKGMTALDYMKSEKSANDPERDEKIRLLEEAMKKYPPSH